MAGENTFSAGTLIESVKVGQNFTGAYTGDYDETENSLRTFRDESVFDHVVSGGIITDPGVSLSQTTTAIVIVLDGRRITIGATAKTYTASKDTYVDILRSGSSGSYVYTEVTNNAASPALAANSIRIAIVTTDGSQITNSNQGEETQVIPIASSVAYSVTDSLGNLIRPLDPTRRLLGHRQRVSNFAAGSSAEILIAGLNCAVIVPTNRKVCVSFHSNSVAATTTPVTRIYSGVFGSGGTQIQQYNGVSGGAAQSYFVNTTPATASITFSATAASVAGATTTEGTSTNPCILKVELY